MFNIFRYLSIIFLIIILLLLLYKFKYTESFNEDGDIIPERGNGFKTVNKEIDVEKTKLNENRTQLGSANDWGGIPVETNLEMNKEKEIDKCNEDIININKSFIKYRNENIEKAKLSQQIQKAKQIENNQTQNEILGQQRVINDATKKNIVIVSKKIIAEDEKLKICLKQVEPLDIKMKIAEQCCDNQTKMVKTLDEQYKLCIHETYLLSQQNQNTQKNILTLENELKEMKITKKLLLDKFEKCTQFTS